MYAQSGRLVAMAGDEKAQRRAHTHTDELTDAETQRLKHINFKFCHTLMDIRHVDMYAVRCLLPIPFMYAHGTYYSHKHILA